MVLTGSLSRDLESPCLLDYFEIATWGGGVQDEPLIHSNFQTASPGLGTLAATPTPTPKHRTLNAERKFPRPPVPSRVLEEGGG